MTEEQALQLLERDLSRYVGKEINATDFPEEARRWNWSGTTLVQVSMAADGSMKEVAVQRSSGFRLLDQQAVRIVRRITVPPVPERLRGREVAVTVPIGFYLSER
ncbi:MAG TPA: energy transducer TonB [Burkholderiales bacterium]|nr:energy transducer TonB [Burkholderiales bacterium]